MKILISFLFVFLLIDNQAKAQFEWGFLVGGSSVNIKPQTFVVTSDSKLDSFSLAFKEANYGVHFGGFVRFNLGHFIIQPELLFNSNKTSFKWKEFGQFQTSDSILYERYQRLDIPLIMGFKFGIFRINGGPVSHIFINNKSDLVKIKSYSDKFNASTFGYQVGLGFDFGLLTFDLRHEGNFNKFGDHINFFGRNYAFANAETRLIGTVGLKF
ncbi:MAG: hypothetical protein ABIO44_01585 [Saprospiraceae bacterium]